MNDKSYLLRQRTPGSLHPVVRCWCRACQQYKNENEMFAGIIHPDGIGRGICNQCHQTGKDVERWKRLDEQTAPNKAITKPSADKPL